MITINKIIIQRIKEFIEKIELNKLMSVNKTSRHRQETNRLIPQFFVRSESTWIIVDRKASNTIVIIKLFMHQMLIGTNVFLTITNTSSPKP